MLTPAVVQIVAATAHPARGFAAVAQDAAAVRDALLDPAALLVTPEKPDGLPKARDLL